MSEKNKKTEVDLNQLAEWSGENTVRRFKYVVPILKFNGNTGKFSLLIPDTESEDKRWIPEEIKKSELKVVLLKVRRVLSSYEKLPDGSGLRQFTNEHNSWKDELTVFEMKKGDAKPKMINKGSSEEMRKAFPSLRLRQNLYCLYDDKVVKLTARGKSLSSLFNYYGKFKASEHTFQFVTKLTCHDETNEGGLTYYVIDWERGKESDLPFIAEKIKEVKDSLDLLDKQYADRGTPETLRSSENEKEEKTEVEKSEEEVKPEDQGEKEGEIQVKDLPL